MILPWASPFNPNGEQTTNSGATVGSVNNTMVHPLAFDLISSYA